MKNIQNKMRPFLLSILIFSGQLLLAQSFMQVLPDTMFNGVWSGSVAFADVDGDSDQDVFITGHNLTVGLYAKLYINNGGGNFTELEDTPFEKVGFCSVAFADVDGDNDQDLLITGKFIATNISKLYTNDGNGIFTEMIDTPFEGVGNSSAAFVDVDGDNDQDVLITGRTNTPSAENIAKLYTNDGNGFFTEMMASPFEGVQHGSVAFADVDGDNDQDLLITGRANNGTPTAKLFKNNGLGTFTNTTDTIFQGVWRSSIAFADIDGDDDQDVLITGRYNTTSPSTRLYSNNGQGAFVEVTDHPFNDVGYSSVAFSDVDGDNDQDVLITGVNLAGEGISIMYINDGQGTFSELADTPFEGVERGSVAFADIDGDNDQDVLIAGMTNSGWFIAHLFSNGTLLPTSVKQAEKLHFDFEVFPNPINSTKINISLTVKEKGFLYLSIFDLNGSLIKRQRKQVEREEQTISMDIRSLSKGSYFIQLENENSKGVRKVFVY